MKNRPSNILFVVMAAIMTMTAIGCSSSAHVEKDDSVNFRKYKTYSWVSEKEKSLKERHSNNLIDKRVKEAVTKELRKNGWVETKYNPEVLIDYNIMVENNVKEQSDPLYSRPFTRYFYNPVTRRLSGLYYPSEMMGYDRYQIPYKAGTITIHMIDNQTNKLIWQGWATNEVGSHNLTSKEINSGVHSILKKFNPSEG
jgi:uncharacterized protein DUF4136